MGELFNAIIGKPEPTAEIDESLALSLVTSRSIQEWLHFIILPQIFGLKFKINIPKNAEKKFNNTKSVIFNLQRPMMKMKLRQNRRRSEEVLLRKRHVHLLVSKIIFTEI